jgi:hypothetical protein
MLVFGIDVVLVMLLACGCVIVAFIASLWMPLDHDAGWACIISTTITAIVMMVGYIVIAEVLDMIAGL